MVLPHDAICPAALQLQEFWAEYNNLTGSLPESYKALSHLQKLVLNTNSLSGSIPASYSALKDLSAIYLFNNSGLKGCLPPTWQQQLDVQQFDVDYFVFDGTGLLSFSNCTGAAAE